MAQFADTDVSCARIESQIFYSLLLNVINLPINENNVGFEGIERIIETKSHLEKLIVSNGGSKVQNDSE